MPNRPIAAGHTVSVAYVGAFFDYLQRRGHDAAAYTRQLGISENEPLAYILAASYIQALHEAAERLGDPDIGLHVGERIEARHLGVQGYAVMSCATAEEALGRALRYETLVDTVNRVRLSIDGLEAALVWDTVPGLRSRIFSELDLTSWVVFSRLSTGYALPFLRAEFSHAEPADTREHRRILQCPLVFGALTEKLVFPAAVLQVKMPKPDPTMRRMMDEYGERLLINAAASADPIDQARAHISRQLAHAAPMIEDVARALELTVRTLQRKLAERGLTFSGLVDGVRRELAERYLRDPAIQISEVAFLLGYSEQSAFQRAFKRWTGDAPGGYRQRTLASPFGRGRASGVWLTGE